MTDIREYGTHQDRARAGDGFTGKSRKPSPQPLFELPPERIKHPEGGYLPDWLCAEIHASNGPAFRTYAAWCRCPKCRNIILAGLDDPSIAANATVDPTPLSAVQELICALENRKTYRLHHIGTTARIQARDKHQPPAGTPGTPPVVPGHHCQHRFPGFTIPPAPERLSHDRPPF